MIVIKHVPTEPGLTAAHAAFEAHGADGFRDFAEYRSWFDATSLRAPALAEVLAEALPGISDTPMGSAWRTAMTEALALTEADEYRGYDEIQFDNWERTVAGAIYELADAVRDASPLLDDVATTIRRHGNVASYRHLDDMDTKRAEVTSEGIQVLQRSVVCDRSVVVPWSHMEHLVDDLHDRVVALLEALRMETPEAAREKNPGSSRTPKAYALK